MKMRTDRENLPPNKALEACAKACGFELPCEIRRPVLALREEISDGLFRNCTLQDLRDLIDYLRLYGTQHNNGFSYSKLEEAPVMGASNSCCGEMAIKKAKLVVPTLIPEGHPIVSGEGEGSDL